MRKLNQAVERFAVNHPNFGIPNLMKWIVMGNVFVYLLTMFAGYEAVSFLTFQWQAILSGELWRLVTFIFVPASSGNVIWLALFLYLYYMIGTSLEREWGTAKFSLYYLSGVVFTVLSAVILAVATGQNVSLAGTDYVNQSLFFAFALLYPDLQFLLFLIIPVKVKWLAILDAVLFGLNILFSLLRLDILGALLPLIALANFFVFFWTAISDEISYRRGRARHQTSRQTIHFKSAVRQQKKKEAARGYRHKCAVCGRTDADSPQLEFRYCSRCAGYHCFCQDHIFSHEHFTE